MVRQAPVILCDGSANSSGCVVNGMPVIMVSWFSIITLYGSHSH